MANIENKIINQMKQSESVEFFQSPETLRNLKEVHYQLFSIIEDEFDRKFPKKIIGYSYQPNIFWGDNRTDDQKRKDNIFFRERKIKKIMGESEGEKFINDPSRYFLEKTKLNPWMPSTDLKKELLKIIK